MNYSKIPLAQTVVALCKYYKIAHVVISPGSRNAPLTIGFTHDEFFNCYSIVDERCAAFFALGIAQQSRRPVALVCTSGSALLNYFPAISEAYYSNIPLVVLSADRPRHLIDIGDGQTIKQPNVYGEHVHASVNLKLDVRSEEGQNNQKDTASSRILENKSEYLSKLQKNIQTYNEQEAHKALNLAFENSGPVHINVPFDEPLYERLERPSIHLETLQVKGQEVNIDTSKIKESSGIWQNTKKKMILVGELYPNSIEKIWLNQLADDNSIVVFTETTSNLNHPDFFPGIDKIIAPLDEDELIELRPDLLLTIGGMIVSKKIKAFLRQYKPKYHWHVGPYNANDSFFCLKEHFKMPANIFFSEFLPSIRLEVKSDYKPYWSKVRDKRRARHSDYLGHIPFSDFIAFEQILATIPKNSQLQVGNSSAIRYTQLFQMRRDIKVFCNRGTSGIDGSTSTALGSAVFSAERVTLLTGDLSFFYDSNALWNNYIPSNFRIILINNSGGGIFRILPGHKNTDNFDTYFETKHNLKADKLCEMFNFEYTSASTEHELEAALDTFYDSGSQPKLLEIFTPSKLNDGILLEYFDFIK